VTFDGPFSPVPFKGRTCRIAAVFNDSCSNAALFLCNPDCVAERGGFEPSVPFWTLKSRLVRNLQIAKARRRILLRKVPWEFRVQSGFHSLFHRLQWANHLRHSD
jgi:hypothetical protein